MQSFDSLWHSLGDSWDYLSKLSKILFQARLLRCPMISVCFSSYFYRFLLGFFLFCFVLFFEILEIDGNVVIRFELVKMIFKVLWRFFWVVWNVGTILEFEICFAFEELQAFWWVIREDFSKLFGVLWKLRRNFRDYPVVKKTLPVLFRYSQDNPEMI